MAYQPTLQATPSIIIIDIEAGKTTGSTQIEYSKDVDYGIWHRWKSGAWLRVALQVTAPDDPALRHGNFSSPKLGPGSVYEVSVWDAGIDPNRLPHVDQPPSALTALTVFALKKRPEVRRFWNDENQRTGGTYREHQLATTAPVYAYMAVSTDPPVNDGTGFLTFARNDGYTLALLNQSFLLQITDLLPGTRYHELIRLSDAFGNWEFLTRDFETLMRRIRVEPTAIYIIDDSDALSNGEGSFDYILETGDISDPTSWKERGTLSYSNSNLETGKYVTPAPSGQILIGPERVSAEGRHARLSVSGTEQDDGGFVIDDDDVGNGVKDLLLPSGPDEVVSHRTDYIAAKSWIGDDEFLFNASFTYWVEYF
jgi:hypothetical protein